MGFAIDLTFADFTEKTLLNIANNAAKNLAADDMTDLDNELDKRLLQNAMNALKTNTFENEDIKAKIEGNELTYYRR